MKKVIGILLGLILASGVAYAQRVDRNPATVTPSGETVIVPEQATDKAPVLEKAIFIHYKKGFAKPPWAGGGKKGGPACYAILSKGAKLKSTEDLTIHPDLNISVITTSAATWDANTSVSLFGSSFSDPSANWDSAAPDGRNELSYGNYPRVGVIAVTVVWGYFSGPPQIRKIVEFDVLFDTDYIWGDATVDPNVMDLQNIATHEIGHGVGLADVYKDACSEVTMYGYSNYGETKKRILELPDIIGLRKLYGI